MSIIKKVTSLIFPDGDKVVGVRVSLRRFKAVGVSFSCVTACIAISCQAVALNPPSTVSKTAKGTSRNAIEAPSVNGWKLDQRSRVLGDQTLYVCPIGVKTVNRKDGVTIMTPAPFQEVITFSSKTGMVCRKSFAYADNPYARAVAMFSGVAHGQMPLTKVRDFRKGGIEWSEFKIPESYGESRKALFKRNEVTSSEPSSGRIVCFQLPVQKRAVDWIARLFCVPRTGAIPFDVTFTDVDGDVHSMVKTFNMTLVKLSAADFKCPSGLRAVKDPRSVIQDESSTDAIEMMMGK